MYLEKKKKEPKNNILTPCRQYILKKNTIKKGRGGAGKEI